MTKSIQPPIHRLSRWAFLVFCAAALCILGTGCVVYTITAAATSYWSVDSGFAKTHDLNFKQPSTKTKAVLLIEHKGIDIIPKGRFYEAINNSGAFSQVAEASNEHDLQKYPGWDVIRVLLTHIGNDDGVEITQIKYQIKIRFEFQTPSSSAEYVYTSGIWHLTLGGKPPNIDEAHPPTSADQATRLFVQELVLAACSEVQRAGSHFQ